jgi:hypothetical protein
MACLQRALQPKTGRRRSTREIRLLLSVPKIPGISGRFSCVNDVAGMRGKPCREPRGFLAYYPNVRHSYDAFVRICDARP